MTPELDLPRLYVDFNEMVAPDVVLLSRDDEKVDSGGSTIAFTEGLRVHLYMPDADETGATTNLLATGIAERNRETADWCAQVRWRCRIDGWHR